MEKLNNKIKNGRSEKIDDAQMVGNYGYDSTIDKLRRLTCDTNGALHVDVHGGSSGSGDLKCRTDIADPATSTFVKCNADGTLEMTAELSSAGLATSVIQTDGSQKARCMGGETDGTQRQLLTSNLGVLQVLDSEVFGKTSQIANQTTLSNTNEATIIANQTNGTQKATVGNTVGDGSGTAKNLLCDADGHLQVDIVSGGGGGTQFAGGNALVATGTGTAMIGRDSGNVARLVATDTSGHIEVVSSTGAGIALESAQTTGNASLSSIDGKITAPATTAVVLTSTSTAISAGATQDFKTGTTGFTQFNVAGVKDLTYIIEGSGTAPTITPTELVGAVTGVLVPVTGLGVGSTTANFAFSSSISAQHRGLQIKNNSASNSYTVTKITAVYTT